MEVAAQHEVNFDYAIVIPHLMFNYKAVDKASIFQQAFITAITAEKTSGYILIKEPIEEINDTLFEKYTNTLGGILLQKNKK